jgi:Xaa-Pro aminopeptidase
MKFVEDVSLEGRKAEVEIKVARILRMLDEEGLEGLVLTKHTNFSWLTAGGKSIVTLYLEAGNTSLLVTRKGCYAVTSIIEENRMREEELLEDLGFKIESMNWYEDKTAEIVKKLAGCPLSKIGTDLPLGDAKLINDKIGPLRYSLTENEIARYQYLGDTLSTVLEEYIASVKPGMTEYEITGGLCNALWKYNIDQALFIVATDERAYRYRHAIPTGKKLKDHLCLSVNGRYKGLITTVTRMVHFGRRDEQLLKQYDDTAEIECRTIASIRIGEDDIAGYRANKKAYEDLGYGPMWYLHGQGGAQGYNNRDYQITETVHGITQENQCYCFNPVIDGTKTEDAFIATKDGILPITKPISFPVLEKEVDGKIFEKPGLLFID